MAKKWKYSLISVLLVFILATTFLVGCNFGISTRPKPSVTAGSGNASVAYDAKLGQAVYDQVWNILQSDYVEKDKLNSENLTDGAINGLLNALHDPYTDYFPPSSFQAVMTDIQGQFQGIGAYMGHNKQGDIVIIGPVANSPADKAGIKPGDKILAINGVSTEGMSIDEIVAKVRGPKGTKVNLKILHEGDTQPVDISITRDEITLPSVKYEMKGDYAYIRISSFAEDTNNELGTALAAIEKQGAKGIVLDLRSNPGGLLDSVINVASRFIDSGVVLTVRDNQGKETTYKVEKEDVTTSLPMVTLTDNYTASAAEVLTGALQDHHRSVIAGTVTFGKGSVNTIYNLKDGSGLKLTVARWLTPDGRLIEGKGITPDYILTKDQDQIQWALDYLQQHGN